PSPAAAATLPYQDPTLPVATRVADLLARMSLDDKLGQMTQAERTTASPADVTNYRLGSILSGGGSAPSPNTPTAWADMIHRFQDAALATPLGIPLLYGTDAVHEIGRASCRERVMISWDTVIYENSEASNISLARVGRRSVWKETGNVIE